MPLRFIAQRLLQFIPVFFGVTFLSFLLIRAAPGDAAHFYLAERGADLSHEALAQARRQLGLDKTIAGQYAAYLRAILKGDFGNSYITKEPVSAELKRRFRVTLLLALATLPAVLLIAFPLGAFCALKHGSAFDKAARALSTILTSLPSFCVAFLFILIFGAGLRLIPVFGASTPAHYILPCLTLVISSSAYYTRFIRAAFIEEFSKEYIKAAKSRGLSLFAIVRSSLKNAMLPVFTSLGMSLASLLGGQAIIEKIFALPGMGSFLIDAVIKRDYAVVDGCVLLYAALFACINLCADILCAYLNPLYEK
ncbi:MAG: ABC transporter permease [Termitinemataceae bacterium]|nr:MAG: ABC transporter permease [Termitinemataceae bacterium]